MAAVLHSLPASLPRPLNPEAAEFLPKTIHQSPPLPLQKFPPPPPKVPSPFILPPLPPQPHFRPPLKFLPPFVHPPLPPPPHFLPPPVHGCPVQQFWVPVPFIIPDAKKPNNALAASPPPPPEFNPGDRGKPSRRGGSSFRIPMSARRKLPPRHCTLPPPKKQSLWRRKASPQPISPPPENETVVFPFGDCTTLMIRNIPNRLRQRELVELLAEHCAAVNAASVTAEFDFVYLPVDFARLGNKGYAFVNFTTAAGAATLHRAWSGLQWVKYGYQSPKVRRISAANLQGKQRLREHFRKAKFECYTDDYLPVELSPACDGFNLGDVRVVTVGSWLRCGM